MLTEIEKQYLLNNYVDKGALFCSQQLNLSCQQIRDAARRLKLKISKICRVNLSIEAAAKWRNNRTYDDYSVNPLPFINPITKEICYLLGLLWADGNVRTTTNGINIEIMSSDAIDIQDLFTQTGRWSITTRQRNHYKQQTRIAVDNPIIHQFLVENNYQEKSIVSPDIILQKIPDNLTHYFIRGVVDGDGCIYIHSKSPRIIRVVIAGSYKQDWNYLIKLSQQLNFTYTIRRVSRINPKTHKLNQDSTFQIQGGRNATSFLNYIYNDYSCIGFTRKYQKYLEILKTAPK